MPKSLYITGLFGFLPGLINGKNGENCFLYPPHQDFKEPPVITGAQDVTLTVETLELCSPVSGMRWMTRAYGASSHGFAPGVPGPTIVTKAGGTIRLKVQNKLGPRNPNCSQLPEPVTEDEKQRAEIYKGQCSLNSTNIHTHGLHVNPAAESNVAGHRVAMDSIWKNVHPGEELQYVFPILDSHMAGTHWYHPHRHHAASVQAGGGMHGALIIEDPKDSLPSVVQDMPSKVMVLSLVDMRWSLNRSWSGVSTLEHSGDGGLWKVLNSRGKGRPAGEDLVVVLVNGMWRPKISIEAGKWYRLRFVFAAVEYFVQMGPPSTPSMKCEFQLLAKDGIYLNVAPRHIPKIYLASGNRADVAMRCDCTSGYSCEGSLMTDSADPQKSSIAYMIKHPKQFLWPMGHVVSPGLTQELVKIVVTPRSGHTLPSVPLPFFSVVRPCYLVDLRYVPVPTDNFGRVDFWLYPEFKVTWTDFKVKFQGTSMFDMTNPPLHEFKVGQVYQLYIRGPKPFQGIAEHPFHLHTVPYQITSMISNEPYYQVGDWHDTLLHTSGQAVIKLQTGPFIGHHVVHCHILTHEDEGMMAWFNVTGEEGTVWRGAEQVDPTCYRRLGGASWKYATGPPLPPPTRWTLGPAGEDCHSTCSFLGGCIGWGWPESKDEFTPVLLGVGKTCKVTGIPAPWNPSASGTLCGWKHVLGNNWHNKTWMKQFRCGVRPPKHVARICPCRAQVYKVQAPTLV